MISEMKFFENATESELSEAMINVKGGILTIQATGTATSFEYEVLGCLNTQSEQFVALSGVNVSNFSIYNVVNEKGIYEYDINGIRQIKVLITSIEGGDLTIIGTNKEG